MAIQEEEGKKITVMSSSAVLESLRRLQLDRMFTDCTLMAPTNTRGEDDEATPKTERRMDCHRAVLAAASAYFADALKAPGTVLHIREYSADILETIVGFVYTGYADISDENLFGVYEAASRLAVNSLSDACSKYLVERAKDGKMGLMQRLDVGLRLGEPKLVQPCMEELLVGEFQQLETEDITILSEKSMRLLLLSEDLQIEEIFLFRALKRWGEARCPPATALGVFLRPYLPFIRYALMTAAELEEEVVPNEFVPRDILLDAALALCKPPAEWDISKMQLRQRSSIYVYRWRIDWNAVQDQEEIWSEPFSFFFGGVEHRWKLLMYPKGKSAPKYVSFFLYVDMSDPSSSRFTKSVDFDFLLTDFTKRKRTQFFAKEPSTFSPETSSWGFTKFRERNLLEKENSPFLQDGFIEFELAMKMHSVDLTQ